MKNNRIVAFEILNEIQVKNAYSNLAVDKGLKNYDGKDKGFISNLVYGVIERQITLDYILNQYLTKKVKQRVLVILRMGVYQLYFMDRVPSSAAVNESVELTKYVGAEGFVSLVNAVLRKIDKNRINIDELDDLSIKYSCPQHLINMWSKAYTPDGAKQIVENINAIPPVFAIPNTLFNDANELLYELNCEDIQGEVVCDVVKIQSHFDLNNCKAFQNGLFYIEDLSSYNCAKELNAQEDDVVIDICSAPGGKAFTIAQSMNNKGTIYAYDLHEHRCKLIVNTAKRLGITNIITNENDATVYNSQIPMADKILCDVPCSGFGIIRRKPEIRYKNLDSIKELPDIQYAILNTSSKYLKENGTIIYSTCTLNKRENEKIVAKFLQENDNFKLKKEQTTLITKDGGDGFYFAVMEKTND